MRKLGLWLATILLVCLSMVSFACTSPSDSSGGSEVKDAITLSETAITLEVGSSQTLTATTNVTTGVQWSTSDDSIATVDGGVVNALSAGTAIITATAGDASATCTVTVNELREYVELTVDKDVVELKKGGAGILVTATFMVDDEVLDCDFVWTSEDDAIATVEDGNILPVGVGSTVVTVSVEYKGETYYADVNVEVNPDEQIQVSKGTIELALIEINDDIVSDTFTATAYKAGVENTEAVLEFVSSNEAVAIVSVEAGVATVTSVGEGTCTISVSYVSDQGKIETIVTVIVARSTLVFDEIFEVPYVEGNTVFDIGNLEVYGSIEGVYAEGEKVSSEDGVLDAAFVEKNKGIIIPVEVRTTLAIYEAELLIAIPYVAEPKQEKSTLELVDMPTFDGDATTLGFPAGTDTVYEIVIDGANGADGWTNRMLINAATDKDVVVFDIITSGLSEVRFTAWPAKNTTETQGSYGLMATSTDPSSDADLERKVFILGADDKRPSTLTNGTIYTVYFFLNKGESHVHFSTFVDGTVYVANIRCIDADEVVNDPTLPPPPISQGEARNEMPTFNGDVTALGFAQDTVVYQIDGAQSDTNDVKLVAQIDSSGDMMYAKLDFVLSASTSSLGLWITAANSHLGYYTITPTGITVDALGDPSREIFVTDADGERVSSFEANTMYTLYVLLDGREATIQFTTWANLTIYVANVGCVTEDELPFDPTLPPIVQGKEISVLFIGNSFSDDTEAYIIDILLNLGYTNVDVGNLYIGGCDIDTHYNNILNDASAYDFRMRSHNGRKYTEYVTTTVGGTKKSLDFAIAYKDWDIISVQQASGYSGQANTYENLDALVAAVRNKATNPDVEFVFNMTWAYQANSTHAQFPDYDSDQMTMYNAIVNAVQSEVTYTVVPNATAIQNARTSFIGDTLTRDGYHLDLKIGRYIAGLTFVAKVTGVDITDFDYAPNGVSDAQLAVAIESVQNAINNPFAVTESEIKDESMGIPGADSLITAGGTNTGAVTIVDGTELDLGFAEGATVYKYVGIDSTADKVAIKVDSDNYDYVDVQFVIASGDGYFFAYALKNGNYLNNGTSYVIDPSWLRLADGNAMDRVIQVLDANGALVSTLMRTNTLYTLRVYIEGTDQIMVAKSGSTIYFANVTYGLTSDLPVEGPIKQGDTQAALPTYDGDETAHGFEEGEFLQYMVTETTSNVWGAEPTSGKTREQLAAKILGETGKYVTIKFAVSEDVASGSVFYVWGLLGTSHTINGAVNFTDTTYGRILDVNGYAVTSLSKNTVYVLELYMAGTDTYKVSNIVATGMELYFAPDSITCSDDSIEVQAPTPTPDPEPDPEPQAPIVSAETASTALSVYEDDVTALGFAEGTTVYQLTSANSWNDRVKIAADPSYKYLDVEFIVSSGVWYFNVWVCNAGGMLDGSYFVAEMSGGTQHATFGQGFAIHNANQGGAGGNTKIQVFKDGNPVIGGRTNGTIYTLRVWLESESVTEIQLGQDNVTMYFGNIGCTNSEPKRAITQGDGQSKLPTYDGDETAHGFEEGEALQYMVTETVSNVWEDKEPTSGKKREQLAAKIPGKKDKYVTIRFAVSEDVASGSVFYVWGLLGDTYTANGAVNFTDTTYGRILDVNGYAVTSLSKNTVYVLELYMAGTDTYKVSNIVATGMELYFAPDSITYSDVSAAV